MNKASAIILGLLCACAVLVYLYGRSDATVEFIKDKAEQISKTEKNRRVIDGKFESRGLNDLCVDVGGLRDECNQ